MPRNPERGAGKALPDFSRAAGEYLRILLRFAAVESERQIGRTPADESG